MFQGQYDICPFPVTIRMYVSNHLTSKLFFGGYRPLLIATCNMYKHYNILYLKSLSFRFSDVPRHANGADFVQEHANDNSIILTKTVREKRIKSHNDSL